MKYVYDSTYLCSRNAEMWQLQLVIEIKIDCIMKPQSTVQYEINEALYSISNHNKMLQSLENFNYVIEKRKSESFQLHMNYFEKSNW